MTDRDIHDAFERMRPSQAAKDRMLENILSSAPLLEKRRKRRGWKTLRDTGVWAVCAQAFTMRCPMKEWKRWLHL